jgi:hypothetical protein
MRDLAKPGRWYEIAWVDDLLLADKKERYQHRKYPHDEVECVTLPAGESQVKKK